MKVHVDATAWTPPAALEERVAELWAAGAGERFDGTLLAVRAQGPDSLVVRPVRYRYFFAQRRDPSLRAAFGLRALAVSGLVETDEGVVWARRGHDVDAHPGCWELVPSGSVEAAPLLRGELDLLPQLLRELDEEVNVPADAVSAARPLGSFSEAQEDVLDVVFVVHLRTSPAELRRRWSERRSREYVELAVVAPSSIAAWCAANGDALVPLSLDVLRAAGRL